MDVDIMKKFIPDEYTLKCKSSINILNYFLSLYGNDERVV